MLRRSFLIGLVLGLITGALSLETGTLVIVLVAPAFVWGAREGGRPIGCAGLLAGAGAGVVGVLAFAEARCAADPTCTMSTPLTGFYLLGAVLAVVGVGWTIVAATRLGSRH